MTKALWIPELPANLFSAKRFIKTGGILQKGKLVNSQNRKEVCTLDSNLSIIKDPESCNAYTAFPASLEKVQPNIKLFHCRFSYLSLDNIRATRKIVIGMEFQDSEKKPLYKKVYELCELGRPIWKTQKNPQKQETEVGRKFHIDILQ